MKKAKITSFVRNWLKHSRPKRQFGFVAAGVGFAAVATQAHAQTIISDDFNEYGTGSAYDHGTWPGSTPDLVNLPGGTWQQTNGFPWGLAQIQGSGSNYNHFSESIGNTAENGTGMGISIASSGGYVEPTQLSISADVAIEANGNTPAQNNYELGFYDSTTTFSTYNYQNSHFTGLNIDEAGDLSLLIAGSQVGSSVAYGGTFDPNALNTLSFSVNTATGTISNISFEGSSADYSSLESGSGLFSASAIYYAGNYASGSQNDNGSATGNFLVEGVSAPAVPEPQTYAYLAGALLALGAYQYRRWQFGSPQPAART